MIYLLWIFRVGSARFESIEKCA